MDPPLQSAHSFSFSSVLVFTLINCTVRDLEEANTEAVIDRMPHPSSSFMTSLILTNKTRRKTIYRKLLIAQHSVMKFLQYVTCAFVIIFPFIFHSSQPFRLSFVDIDKRTDINCFSTTLKFNLAN